MPYLSSKYFSAIQKVKEPSAKRSKAVLKAFNTVAMSEPAKTQE